MSTQNASGTALLGTILGSCLLLCFYAGGYFALGERNAGRFRVSEVEADFIEFPNAWIATAYMPAALTESFVTGKRRMATYDQPNGHDLDECIEYAKWFD